MSNYFFEVLRPGINTIFQDKGRFHMQHLGVTPGGCMDLKSFSIANALVGNTTEEGVLEFAYQGPLLKLIKGQTKIAITGNVIFQIIQHLDIALLDGTFYSQGELPNRDMSEIPHPFIVESMDALYPLNTPNRNKVHFIHFNHSNPAIKNGTAFNLIRSNRFNVAREGMIFPL